MAENDFDIFLAHNGNDKPQIRVIGHGLKRRGLKPWLDDEQILAGQSFQKVIQAAVPRVRAATAFLGPNGLGNWQEEEVELLFDMCKKANKPFFLTLLPGVHTIPDSLGFLNQKHWVSFDNGAYNALQEIESGVRGAPASPFFDVLFCYSNDDVLEVREIETQLMEKNVHPWNGGLNASALQLSVLRDLDKYLDRIWSLAVIVGRNTGPWEQDIIADLILEFREGHRSVIPVVLNTAPKNELNLPVYLRRLGRVDFRLQDPPPFDRLVSGITEGSAVI